MNSSHPARDAMEFLVRYFERAFGTTGTYRWHEDENAYYLFVRVPKGIVVPELRCFDERRMLFGRRRVFCYDEDGQKKISITLDYSGKKLKMVTLALFKPSARLRWPPRPSPT
ncbi:MAG: hypothetical protein NZ953_00890 [Thaumarchaeota archaeon]|nr:hypothetical protein [Candidatus Calditenuaceae archaeon]